MNKYNTHIEIEGLFGEKDIRFSPDPKVNVLAGINGSGKSTVLKILYKAIAILGDERAFIEFRRQDKPYRMKFMGLTEDPYDYFKIEFNIEVKGITYIELLNTFDNLFFVENEEEKLTHLDILLYEAIYNNNSYGNKKDASFIKYESKLLKQASTFYRKGDNDNGDSILKVIDDLLSIINDFLKDSDKKLELVDDIDKRIQVVNSQNKILEFKQLSSGEKQLLYTLFKVFLLEKEPSILFLDEPEITLHIKWQRNLIDAILKINPNVQLFIATHASSIFFNGYQDKLILMEDISFPMKTKESVE